MLFFKKKPILKELVSSGYVDIHSHVLPGIDDGSKDVETSEVLLNEMGNIGFSKVITTPHTLPGVWDNSRGDIENAFTELNSVKGALCSKYELRVASEYFLDNVFLTKILDKGNLLTLKDNYLLVELSYLNPPIGLKDIIFAVQMGGYQPVLAHPERYLYYHRDKGMYDELKAAGCMFQLNLLSSVGYYGKGVSEIADYLLESDMIDYTGSDIHHIRHVKSFGSKVVIKSIKPLQEAMERNSFFGS
ncbi:capsular polysaccharide biosynthesis protein [Neptunitalea chrysea]|uniref:protein-tyrosine-phosphatase n=1 Tax=Neptunitalea chrysea TaxID=1647581 RepID=A0A9W6B369_9FLAO|nr:CpsB/CapC family capsule biosynthesis tyrosine phosphatase [Neptunitalea chrysea]GLB51564.1 capsular polysaccharide biosynthesis protein [Neptunitalea chrysea]